MLNIPFTTTRLQALLASLSLATVAALVGLAGGYHLGGLSAKADLADLQRSHAIAQAEASEKARSEERALAEAANALGEQLLEERAQHAQETDQLKRRIERVTSQYRPAPDAPLQPAPRCVFTNGFVGVWNAAIDAGPVPAADPAAGVAEAAGRGEALDSGVQPADILANHADNGQRCRDIESQLNRVIDYLLDTKGVQ